MVINLKFQPVVQLFINSIGFVAVFLLVYGGYLYVTSNRNIPAVSGAQSVTETLMFSLEPDVMEASDSSAIQDRCSSEKFISHFETLSLCIPIRLHEQLSSETRIEFGGSEELLTVVRGEQAIPLHLCNLSKQSTVDGEPAVRTILRIPVGTGCEGIGGFRTQFAKDGKPYSITFLKTSGLFSDEREMNELEESIQLK